MITNIRALSDFVRDRQLPNPTKTMTTLIEIIDSTIIKTNNEICKQMIIRLDELHTTDLDLEGDTIFTLPNGERLSVSVSPEGINIHVLDKFGAICKRIDRQGYEV